MPATAIMTTAMLAILTAAMMTNTTVTMGRTSQILALEAVGMTIIIIPVTGFSYSVMSAAVTRCATINAIGRAKSGNFIIEKTATVTAGATIATSSATPKMRRGAS